MGGPEGHQIVAISLVLKAYWHIGMFVFVVIFVPFPENWPILSAFIVPVDGRGGLGAPLSGPEGHQIVDISLVLNAYWHIGMFVFFVIFVPFPEN